MAQPFHAGGAIPTVKLAGQIPHGCVSIFTAATSYWPSLGRLDITHLGSLIAIAGVVPAAWRLVHRAWREAYTWTRHFFIASVVIPGRDSLNRNVVSWALAHVVRPRNNTRFFTARTELRPGRGDDVADLGGGGGALRKKTQRAVQYLPHFETLWFWYRGRPFLLHRPMDSFNASMCDPGYDGIGGEELTVSCLGRSAEPIRCFLRACREYAEQQTQYFVTVYSRDRYGISWQPKSRKPIRLLETVHLDEGVKQRLLSDIRKYLDPETQRRYRSRSMPYRRGYLFYGPPGTGKSSLSSALAGEFGLDLYEVKIPSVASDADLEQMFQEVPPQCIVLLEDIDAVWTDRDLPPPPPPPERDDRAAGPGPRGPPSSNCTLSGLLNVLDGVGSQEGRIVIMTTNKPDRLDGALVRPGRVDMRVHLGNISQRSAEDMFLRMFSADPAAPGPPPREAGDLALRRLASAFSRHIPEDTFTPSQLQGFFQMHLEDAAEAAASIAAWVADEQSRAALDDDDIELVSRAKAS